MNWKSYLCGDANFYGSQFSISKWTVSSDSGRVSWKKAPLNAEGCFDGPVGRGEGCLLRTFFYSSCDRDAIFGFIFTALLNERILVNGAEFKRLPVGPALTPGVHAAIRLKKGWNKLEVELASATDNAVNDAGFAGRVIHMDGATPGEDHYSFSPDGEAAPVSGEGPGVTGLRPIAEKTLPLATPDSFSRRAFPAPFSVPDGFKPGVGAAKKSAGRFAYTKGDGMLDCSMPFLGMISKPHLFGHPGCDKSILWHMWLLPHGINESDRVVGGRGADFYSPGSDESLDVNWMGVKWGKKFVTTKDFYHRKAGATVNFSCSYSIASPGILVESDDAGLRLGGLESAGNYSRIILPLKDGARVRSCADGVAYDIERDGGLAESWVMLCGSGSFPDAPVMLSFKGNPAKIVFNRNAAGGLESVDFVSRGALGHAFVMFPFGMEVFKPGECDDDKWLARAVGKCSFWRRALLAWPVDCAEWFKVDKKGGTVDIVQNFSHRFLANDWGEEPLVVAPLPPPMGLLDGVEGASRDKDAVDLDFPTKYGVLTGVLGRSWSGYSTFIPPTRRDFALRPKGDDETARLMAADFDEYLQYHLGSDEIPNPGAYHFMIQYDLPLLLFNFLNGGGRERLEKIAASGAAKASDPDFTYLYKGGRKCCAWYKRRDPLTGVEYLMGYLHVSGIGGLKSCERDAVESHRKTFIEIDWGNAFALYGMWLSSMLSGDWSAVDKNWGTVEKVFDYFLVLQDWGCMCAGYAENGVTWNDGTNYGAYVGFVRMAEALGREESLEWGLYAFAKLAAMRLALFRSSQSHFHKCFNCEPWWISKCFHAETDAALAFTNVPRRMGSYRPEGIYNLCTEGHYPESWDLYASKIPGEARKLLDVVDAAYGDIYGALPNGQKAAYWSSDYLGHQEIFSCIMLNLMTGRRSEAELLDALERASANHRISEDFLGISLSHRRVPAKWAYCFLKSQIMGRSFPVSMTGWWNLRVASADYDASSATASIRLERAAPGAWIELRLSAEQKSVLLDGKPLPESSFEREGGLARARVSSDGELTLRF